MRRHLVLLWEHTPLSAALQPRQPLVLSASWLLATPLGAEWVAEHDLEFPRRQRGAGGGHGRRRGEKHWTDVAPAPEATGEAGSRGGWGAGGRHQHAGRPHAQPGHGPVLWWLHTWRTPMQPGGLGSFGRSLLHLVPTRRAGQAGTLPHVQGRHCHQLCSSRRGTSCSVWCPLGLPEYPALSWAPWGDR